MISSTVFSVETSSQLAHSEWSMFSVPSESVLKILTSSGLMTYMNPQHIFVTVHDAVMFIQQQKVSYNTCIFTNTQNVH